MELELKFEEIEEMEVLESNPPTKAQAAVGVVVGIAVAVAIALT